MIAPHAPAPRTWFARAWEVTTDLVVATAVIWALPLLFGAVSALIGLLLKAL